VFPGEVTVNDSQTRILVVDDDPQIRIMLSRFLSEHGLAVTQAKDGEELLSNLDREAYDLIVLDIMMPGVDGMSLCRTIRTTSAIPIILLTAVSSETDRIVGLEVGADDYMIKPFNPRELLARIRAVLRRANGGAEATQESAGSACRFDGWTIDVKRRTLSNPQGVLIELTSNEFDLLAVFVQKPQTVLSRDQLLDLAHGKFSNQLDRSIDVQISRLRRKIETNAQSPQIIKTMRNEGYIFTARIERNSG
jgi:two-component system, OmpR family, response regulator